MEDKRENREQQSGGEVIEFASRSRGSQDAPDPLVTESAATAALAEQVARLQAEKEELTQTLVRRQADFENYRKRIERERPEDRRQGAARVVEDLLPVLDAFERALKAHDDPAYEEYRKGLELIFRQLWDLLAKHGLERIAAAGKPFDPYFHQAIERVETEEYPDGTVVEVLQDGFTLHGRVLRPSIVRVSHRAGHAGGSKTSAAQRHSN
jgi:molecular chaperone GrpE